MKLIIFIIGHLALAEVHKKLHTKYSPNWVSIIYGIIVQALDPKSYTNDWLPLPIWKNTQS
jgi:hypothetical protein